MFKYINDKDYIDLLPILEVIRQRKDDLDAKSPIPLDPDWKYITDYLQSWVKIPLAEDTKTNTRWRTYYLRELFRTLILLLYISGACPSKLVAKKEKIREAQKDGSYVIKRVIKGGLSLEDIKI